MTDPLASLDLNLLHTLDVLLRTRSVTRAAEQLGRSQPAVSHALQRLRDALHDPLLVRSGRGMVLTPRAEALRPGLAALLNELRRLLTVGGQFDPTTAQRTFTLACPDMLGPVVPMVLAALSEAPGVSLVLQVGSDASQVGAVDLVLGVMPESAPGVMVRRLGPLRQRVALSADHPALRQPWTPQTYTAWPHILVRTPGTGESLVGRALAAAGLQRRIGLTVPTFLLAPHVAASSRMLFTGAGILLEQVAAPLRLVLRDPPVPMPGVIAAAMWSERVSADPGHRWFRARVISVLTALLED